MRVNINPNIFRAYDIRGVYPQELNPDAAYSIGQAFVKFLKKPRPKVVVGRDNRLSSPILHQSLIKGITEAGADVIDIGLSTTPMFYFAVAHDGYDGGVIVTASHNPSQYNGFKMVREKAMPISEETGLKEIRNLTRSDRIRLKGQVFKKEIVKDYIDFNLREVVGLKPLKIVIDTANAVSGIIIPEIFKKLPCKITHLFKKSDGSFPNHPPNPLIAENLKILQAGVKDKKADLGVAFDGDGDRIIFVDENGAVVSGNLIAALMAALILKKRPGSKILYDVRSSNIVKETIEELGGKAVVGRIGHSFIKEKMRQEKILFASELSGHYYHQDHYFCEAPFFVLFAILGAVSKKPLSQLVQLYQKYYHSGEINFGIADKKAAMDRLKKRYADGKLLEIDGLRVDYQDWWFLARPSNTEPVLRLVIEAKTKELMDKKKKELAALIVPQGNAIARSQGDSRPLSG